MWRSLRRHACGMAGHAPHGLRLTTPPGAPLQDSYMYLTVINGLAAMGDVFPAKVLPRLMAEFL